MGRPQQTSSPTPQSSLSLLRVEQSSILKRRRETLKKADDFKTFPAKVPSWRARARDIKHSTRHNRESDKNVADGRGQYRNGLRGSKTSLNKSTQSAKDFSNGIDFQNMGSERRSKGSSNYDKFWNDGKLRTKHQLQPSSHRQYRKCQFHNRQCNDNNTEVKKVHYRRQAFCRECGSVRNSLTQSFLPSSEVANRSNTRSSIRVLTMGATKVSSWHLSSLPYSTDTSPARKKSIHTSKYHEQQFHSNPTSGTSNCIAQDREKRFAAIDEIRAGSSLSRSSSQYSISLCVSEENDFAEDDLSSETTSPDALSPVDNDIEFIGIVKKENTNNGTGSFGNWNSQRTSNSHTLKSGFDYYNQEENELEEDARSDISHPPHKRRIQRWRKPRDT